MSSSQVFAGLVMMMVVLGVVMFFVVSLLVLFAHHLVQMRVVDPCRLGFLWTFYQISPKLARVKTSQIQSQSESQKPDMKIATYDFPFCLFSMIYRVIMNLL